MLAACDEPVIVADSTKFGSSSLSRLCGLDEVSRLVVDAEITSRWTDQIEQTGVQLHIAPLNAEQNKESA